MTMQAYSKAAGKDAFGTQMGKRLADLVRFLCLVQGVVLAAAAIPFSLLAAASPAGTLLVFIAVFALHAAAFLYAGVMWNDLWTSASRRILGTGLLLVPFASGILLLQSHHPEFLGLALDLCLSAVASWVASAWSRG